MGGEEMSAYLHGDKAYIRLIQCFLSPNLFIQHKESPNPYTDSEKRDREYRRAVENTENHVDYLYELFDPESQVSPGENDSFKNIFLTGDASRPIRS
jgi:hypothetical protein